MKKVIRLYSNIIFAGVIALTSLTACNSNDDGVQAGIEIPGITITDDVDCCSAEEALQVYRFLQTVQIVPELQLVVDGKYNVFAYTKTGGLHTGYNDVYFVATKRSSGNYVKNFDITGISPLMLMTQMQMQHSTPVSDGVESFNSGYLAVKRGWISFVMNSSEKGEWSIDYTAKVLGSQASLGKQAITVEALPEGQQWIKSFKVGSDTYYLSLVDPTEWQTGTNDIKAYVSKKSSVATTPYALDSQQFTIEIDPRMPDMGNHTSPDNTPLVKQSDGSYQGRINLTMTGLWRIHLTVRDADGNVVAGDDKLKDGFSSLYWDVTI